MKKEILADYVMMAKPRLSLLAITMAALGFYLGCEGSPLSEPHVFKFLWTLLGCGLLACSTGALNQYLEIDVDSRMERTKNRPLPTGRLSKKEALQFGLITGALGFSSLLLFVNPMAAVMGGFTLFFYLGIYTSAKKVSPASTLVGAIPGAIPPLIGWTAGHGIVNGGGLILFLILFLWQIPHFLAIGWIYREDYKRAELPILTVTDPTGRKASNQACLFTLALLLVSFLPFYKGMAGSSYLIGAIFLGLTFLVSVVLLAYQRTLQSARLVFRASLFYLPLLAALLVFDSTKGLS